MPGTYRIRLVLLAVLAAVIFMNYARADETNIVDLQLGVEPACYFGTDSSTDSNESFTNSGTKMNVTGGTTSVTNSLAQTSVLTSNKILSCNYELGYYINFISENGGYLEADGTHSGGLGLADYSLANSAGKRTAYTLYYNAALGSSAVYGDPEIEVPATATALTDLSNGATSYNATAEWYNSLTQSVAGATREIKLQVVSISTLLSSGAANTVYEDRITIDLQAN